MTRTTLLTLCTFLSFHYSSTLCNPIHILQPETATSEPSEQIPVPQHTHPWIDEFETVHYIPDLPPAIQTPTTIQQAATIDDNPPFPSKFSPKGPWIDQFTLLHADDFHTNMDYFRGVLDGFATAILYVFGAGLMFFGVGYVAALLFERILGREGGITSLGGHRRGESRFSL